MKFDNSRWFGIDYNMNLYRGCSHGCIYCDSRSTIYNIENFDKVRYKENVIEILSKELRSKRKKGVVGIGAMSDTYNPFEKQLCITKQALDLISENHFGVSID
ncbi:TPA: radical SAM protein [Clostridioides difficile]|uniref:SPL family radical SAM protein n=1 Tax=Clostridioides difficile TaxID=1496 RepID=UPI002F41729E